MSILNAVKRYNLEIYDLYYNSIAELCDNSRTSAYGVTVDKKVNGVATLKFNIPSNSPKLEYIVNDIYLVKFDGDYYFIKNQNEVREVNGVISVECEHVAISLGCIKCVKTNLVAKTARELFETVLNESNWVFAGTDIPDNVLRHFSCDGESLSVLEALMQIAENFNAVIEFGTNEGNRHYVYLRKEIIDNGFYISSKFNLKSLEINRDSKELCTICRVYGAVNDDTGTRTNIMSVNPTGKDYIENYQFYSDIGYTDIEYIRSHPELFYKEITINYDLITDPKELYEIAKEQSKKYAYPKIDCNITFLDLYEMDNRFELDKLVLGERVHVYQFDPIHNTEFTAEAQITGISKNYDNPHISNIEISNTIVYNDSLNKILNNSDKVDRVLGNSSVIHGMYIKEATIDTLHCKDAFITTAKIKDAAITAAKISQAAINTGHIQDAAIDNAKIANASIDDAKILNLSANKLTAGTIDTAEVKVKSANGEVEISGYQILIKDSSDMLNPYVRVVMGKYRKVEAPPVIEGQEDSEDNYEYGIVIRGKDGKTIMWDSNGVHNAGITDGAVDDNKIADNANINGSKIDLESMIRIINEDGTSEKINAMQILIDGKNLYTQFTEMNNTIDGQKKTISQMQSDIKQNADSIKLSVESIEKVEEIVDILGTDVKIIEERYPQWKIVGKVYKNKQNITDSIPSHWFFWTRQSNDPEADERWNIEVGSSGIREIVIYDDYKYNRNANFKLVIDDGK